MTTYDIEFVRLPQGRVAAISTRRGRGAVLGGGGFFAGEKAPEAFLLQWSDGLSCWNVQGERMSEEAVERLYPGALSAFRDGLGDV